MEAIVSGSAGVVSARTDARRAGFGVLSGLPAPGAASDHHVRWSGSVGRG
jgi:hypothetical protein